MAQTNVGVTPGTGKNIDGFATSGTGNIRQTVVIGDPSTDANTVTVSTIGLVVDGSKYTQTVTIPGVVTSAVAGVAASGASLSANPVTVGGLAKTSLPAAVSDGQVVNGMHDKFGRQVVISGTIRDLVTDALVTINNTTVETGVLTQVASTYLDLTSVVIYNSSATATRVDIRDASGGTVRMSFYIPAGDTRGAVFSTPRPQTAVNNNWTAQCSVSVNSVGVYMQAIKNQ